MSTIFAHLLVRFLMSITVVFCNCYTRRSHRVGPPAAVKQCSVCWEQA